MGQPGPTLCREQPWQFYFKKDHLRVLHQDDRRLLAQITAPHFRTAVFAGHAPDHTHDQGARHAWWGHAADLLLKWRPRLGMPDANGRMGATASPFVSDQSLCQGQYGGILHVHACGNVWRWWRCVCIWGGGVVDD